MNYQLLKEMSTKIAKVKVHFKEKQDWEIFVKCENKFNVEKIKDLNLMIVLLKEKEIKNDEDMNQLIDMIQ